MKTNIVINIGLETINGNPVEIHRAIHEIERAGITLLASGIVLGEWEGKQEQTLVIQGLAFPGDELNRRVYSAACALSQHCIAIWQNGRGELIGDNQAGYEFNPELFHFHCRESQELPELSPCQAIQAKHKAKGDCLGASVACEERAALDKAKESHTVADSYIEWLETTLLPDLDRDGFEATADSFRELIYHYKNK